MSDNGYALLDLPKWLLIVRIAQFVVAVIAVGLSGYALNIFNPYDSFIDTAPEGLTIFSAVATWIVVVYVSLSTRLFNNLYNYWAVLACDVVLWIFWLSAMADSAHWTAATRVYTTYYDGYYKRDTLVKRTTVDQLKTARDCVGASAGMGAIEMILFAITIIFTGLAIRSHLQSSTSTTAASGGELGMVEQKAPDAAATAPEVAPAQEAQAPAPAPAPAAAAYPTYTQEQAAPAPNQTY